MLRLLLVEASAATAVALLAPRCHPSAALHAASLAHGSLAALTPALGWWFAAFVMAWLIATTVVCVASRAWLRCSPLRGVEWLGAAVIARYIDAAFALALGVSAITATAGIAAAAPATASRGSGASGPPVTVEVQPDGTLVIVPPASSPPTPAPTTTTPTTSTSVPPTRATPPATATAPPPSTATNVTVTVAAGDNLWRIAADHLTTRHGRPALDDEIVGYWRAVVAANRGTLRSGDPNLIFPGELVTLPALPPAE
jgi:hypothetical protein